MQLSVCMRILGILLMVFSLTNVPPVIVAFIYGDGAFMPFEISLLLTFLAGFLLWVPCKGRKRELRARDGFLVAVLFWVVLSLFAALPLMFSLQPHMGFTDAVFETISGLTTTGSTVITGLDALPHSILYYRQQLQFLGGMGIIVLAVAVLPMLGIGGMQLFRMEMTGPVKDNKLTPRITETAKTLWLIYVGLTLLCALCYLLNGMNLFDAICYAFATISTGGYAPHDASFAFYHNIVLQPIAVFFMVAGALNFALHFVAIRHCTVHPYGRDAETRIYLYVLLTLTALTFFTLYKADFYPDHLRMLSYSLFTVVSLSTTTGFGVTRFDLWPSFLPMLLLYGAIIGGCAGSTSGGMKIIRITLVTKQGLREIFRLIHPRAQYPLKFAGQLVSWRIVDAVWGFVGIYLALFVFLFLLLLATGLDLTTALSALIACLSNTGPGLGKVASSFADINSTAKWILAFSMLLGRLEIFTVLVLFAPSFWRR